MDKKLGTNHTTALAQVPVPVPAVAMALVVAASLLTSGCAIFVHHDRSTVLLKGIDIDQTLDVAQDELEKGNVLTLWAVRDQEVTPAQATRISDLYFEHVESIDDPSSKRRAFSLWHLGWAISNLYRQGTAEVQAELQSAYDDAARRIDVLDLKVATMQFHGDRIYLGDFHGIAHAYAKSHLVVPGNEQYLQCYEEYLNPWKWCP